VIEPEKRPAYEPPTRLLTPIGYDPDMPRPASIVAGTALVMLRVLAGVIVLAALAFGWGDVISAADITLDGFDPSPELEQITLWFALAAGGTILVIDALLGVLVYFGRNWARVLVMVISVGSISTLFVAWWAQGQEITLHSTFLSLSLDILLLLALSSRSAAAYARRNEKR
jgi:hypothetical protein